MNKIVLDTKRRWNWKVFLVLIGLLVPAGFAILPFAMHIQNTYTETDLASLGWEVLLLDRLVNILLAVILGGIGLVLANRIGLGMPFVESWVKRESIQHRFRSAAAVGLITGVVFVLLILLLQNVVFAKPMQALFDEIGYTVPEEAVTPPLYGFLAAFSAGVTEETLFRLFGLSLLAWLGGLLFHDSDGRPKLAVLWIANLLFAIAFGAAHLPTAAAIGWPINALIVTRTIVLNGVGGLALGWLFWTFGLESAMLAHFLADVILYTLFPIIALQEGETAQYIAGAGVLIVILLGLVWAWRTLVTEKRRISLQIS